MVFILIPVNVVKLLVRYWVGFLDGVFGWGFWMGFLDGVFGWGFWMGFLDGVFGCVGSGEVFLVLVFMKIGVGRGSLVVLAVEGHLCVSFCVV